MLETITTRSNVSALSMDIGLNLFLTKNLQNISLNGKEDLFISIYPSTHVELIPSSTIYPSIHLNNFLRYSLWYVSLIIRIIFIILIL